MLKVLKSNHGKKQGCFLNLFSTTKVVYKLVEFEVICGYFMDMICYMNLVLECPSQSIKTKTLNVINNHSCL